MVREQLALWLAAGAASASLTIGLIILTRPWLSRYLTAHPNARSSHAVATPQGAGIAVMLAVLTVCILVTFILPLSVRPSLFPVLTTAMGLTVLGALDDARAVSVQWRLLGQALAALVIVLSLPEDIRVLPASVPLVAERGLIVLGTVWFLNAVNFLDGIDWMTVAEVVPMTLGVAVLQLLGLLPPSIGLLALTLLGAMIGFSVFNKHPASIFLGDAGSLPVGLCIAYMLIFVAGIDLTAAVLFPLYTLADATITLGRRLIAGESMLTAHRSHFYQRAVVQGLTVPQVTARVFVLGLLLAVFAVTAALTPSTALDLVLLVAGGAATGLLLIRLGQSR